MARFEFDLQQFASGAGLNRASTVALSIGNPAVGAVGSPRTAYGTIGLNDSGAILVEARDFTKWTFSLTGGGSGYAFTVYGTNDPVAYAAWRASFNPQAYPNGAPVLPASSWFQLPAPSEQSGTGAVANPMTDASPLMQFSGTLVAVRVVLTGNTGATGARAVVVEATP